MLGYKAAKCGETRVLITLEIPDDAKTNVDRKYVVDKEKAKHRTNRAMVLKIEDADGNSYETAETAYSSKKLTYKVGEVIEEPSFDPTLELVCAGGIHFFLDKRVAELFGRERTKDWTGAWEEWYDNGQTKAKQVFENGRAVGTTTTWFESGIKKMESIELGENKRQTTFYYPTGEKETEYIYSYVDANDIANRKLYYKNGQLKQECSTRNGKLEGYNVEWYENGLKKCEGVYQNDKRNGRWRCWYPTGELESEMSYVNGKRNGMHTSYHKNGKVAWQVPYVNNNYHGTATHWSEDGTVCHTKNYNNGVTECCTIM